MRAPASFFLLFVVSVVSVVSGSAQIVTRPGGGGGGSTAPATFQAAPLVPAAPVVTALAPGAVTVGYSITVVNSIGESCTGVSVSSVCTSLSHETLITNSLDAGAGIDNRITGPANTIFNIYITTQPTSGATGFIAQCPIDCTGAGLNIYTDTSGTSPSNQYPPWTDATKGISIDGTLRVTTGELIGMADVNHGNSNGCSGIGNGAGPSFPNTSNCSQSSEFSVFPASINQSCGACTYFVRSIQGNFSNAPATPNAGTDIGGAGGIGVFTSNNSSIADPEQTPALFAYFGVAIGSGAGAPNNNAGMTEIGGEFVAVGSAPGGNSGYSLNQSGLIGQAQLDNGATSQGAQGVEGYFSDSGAVAGGGIGGEFGVYGGGSSIDAIGIAASYYQGVRGGTASNTGVWISNVSGTHARDIWAKDAALPSEFAGTLLVDSHSLAFLTGLSMAVGSMAVCSDCQVTTVAANVVSNATAKGSGSGCPVFVVPGPIITCVYLPHP